MNENNVNVSNANKNKKKSKKGLIIILIILAIILLVVGGVYLMSATYKSPWKTGEVQILDQNIQLPMLITDFENEFDAKLESTDIDQIKKITIEDNTGTPLNLKVLVFKDSVDGIIITTEQKNVVIENEIISDRTMAKKVIFPGNVTFDTTLEEINNKYQSKPLNIHYKKEVKTEDPNEIRIDEYKWKYGYIAIKSVDNEIFEIEYARADWR